VELNEYVSDGLDDLLRFAYALIPDRGTAEDVVQEVLIKLFLASNRPVDVQHVDAYARRMVVNQYL
jgi:DNA-directed RNA polymerase specialized sigma24 family protein